MTIALGTFLMFTLCSSPGLLFPDGARASSLSTRLQTARHHLQLARTTLVRSRDAYAAAKANGQRRGLGSLNLKVVRDRERVRRLAGLVRQLTLACKRARAAEEARAGRWWPLVRQVAAGEGISAASLYRMLGLESGGRATAVSGPYCGLFQYARSTWSGRWNPWRHRSIWDGAAQIMATARAIHRGWGARMWPTTYPVAF